MRQLGPEGVFGVEALRLVEVVERIGGGRQDAGRGQDVGEVDHLAVLGVPRGDHVVFHGCSCRGVCVVQWNLLQRSAPTLSVIRGLIAWTLELVGGIG